MSKKEKLLKRLLSKPTDFTYDELRTLLSYLGYEEFNKGATSGSRVSFHNEITGHIIDLHKPHPGNVLKKYVIKKVIDNLKARGVLE